MLAESALCLAFDELPAERRPGDHGGGDGRRADGAPAAGGDRVPRARAGLDLARPRVAVGRLVAGRRRRSPAPRRRRGRRGSRSSASAGLSPAKVAYCARSFICSRAIARSRAGWPGGAAPRARSDSMTALTSATQPSITRDQSSRASALVVRSSAAARITARREPKASKEACRAMRQPARGSSASFASASSRLAAAGLDHAVDQGQQDRVLGGEVEVEGGAGDAGAVGQVLDRDLAQRPLLEQPFGRLQDRPLALVAAGAGAAAAAGGGLGSGQGSRHRRSHDTRR